MTNTLALMMLKNEIRDDYRIRGIGTAVEAIDMAIAALEKQEPKEPESKWTEGSVSPLIQKHRAGRCPVCGQGARDYMKFCHHCGQKLDWMEDAE